MNYLLKQNSPSNVHNILWGMLSELHNDVNKLVRYLNLSSTAKTIEGDEFEPHLLLQKKINPHTKDKSPSSFQNLLSQSSLRLSDAQLQHQKEQLLAEVEACLGR